MARSISTRRLKSINPRGMSCDEEHKYEGVEEQRRLEHDFWSADINRQRVVEELCRVGNSAFSWREYLPGNATIDCGCTVHVGLVF